MNKLAIYGVIGGEVIDTEFIALLQTKKGDLTIKINSPGGDVFQGYAIYNALKEYSKGKITIHIDGVAASMASVICLAGDRIIMADNAMYMIHNPKSGSHGESKDLRKRADLLDKIKTVLIESYSKKTQIKKKELESMLDDETWFTAIEAVEAGFVDEIKSASLNKIKNYIELDANSLYACYEIIKPENMSKQLLKLLKLPEGSTEEDLLEAVKKLMPKAKDKKKIEAITNAAITDKKITADMVPHFQNMLKVDFKGTKELLGKMRGIEKLSAKLNTTEAKDKSKLDRSKWGLEEYRKHAPNELKRDPKLYNKLVEAEFKNQN